MGAWGIEPFENDGAGNFASELVFFHAENPAFLQDTLGLAAGGDYVEVDVGQAVIAAAAVVATWEGMNIDIPEHVREWIEGNRGYDASPLIFKAIRALDAVARDAERSEIVELWQGTERFTEWQQTVDRIYDHLQNR